MANIKLASHLIALSGSIGGLVFFNRYGREYARIHVTPANPNTEGQRFIRRTFGDAVRAWQASPREDKEKYNRQARKLAMSGYNLFISRYMKENVPCRNGFAAFQGAVGKRVTILQKASPSVPSPYQHKIRSCTPLLSGTESPGKG